MRKRGPILLRTDIYGWSHVGLLAASEVSAAVIGLSQRAFWNEYHRRELLHALRARWPEFPDEMRARIEARLIAGPDRWRREEDREYEDRRGETSLKILRWLQHHGSDLTRQTSELLGTLRASRPEWRASWEEHADHSYDVKARWVGRDTDPSALVQVPIGQILETADRRSQRDGIGSTDVAPFDGLVAQHPRRALLALSVKARQSSYPRSHWRTLLNHWPESASVRLVRICARLIVRSPDDFIVDCRYDVTSWFAGNVKALAKASFGCVWALFDRILGPLVAAGPEGARSAIGDVSIGGRVVARSRRTLDHSLNSPSGRLARGLFAALGEVRSGAGAGLPTEIGTRLERLLAMPDEAGDYAVCETMMRLRWLFYIDPRWTRRHLVPLLSPDNVRAEPAWNGLLHDSELAGPKLFSLIRSHFMRVFSSAQTWQWENQPGRSLVERLLVAIYWNRRHGRYVTFPEARDLLRLVDDDARAHAVWFLATAFKHDDDWWKTFGRPFIRNAWPRETRFQTPLLSDQFGFFAEQSGNDFPDVVRTVLPLMVSGKELDLTLRRAMRAEGEGSLASRYPREMLMLLDRLVPEAPHHSPYGLGDALEEIAAGAPDLRDDERWRRLEMIARGG